VKHVRSHHIKIDQQRMIEELKYQQEQQTLRNQLANLETLKTQQVSGNIGRT
jgi:hypothetical protein